ncbi:MAG: hypothetical protein OXE86_12360 [Alphaproteobacteria bacterium]|nr:hypothetical protein [Alphaproteobacteria bacterium]
MFGLNKKQNHQTTLPGEIFPPVDLDAIGKQLRLEVRGLENGRVGQPDSNAVDFDPVEREAIAAVGKLRRQGLGNAAEHEQVYRERIEAVDAIGPGIRNIANNTETDFRREVNARRTRLNNARDDLNGSEAGLMRFKQDNGLDRQAYQTGGMWQWWALCSIIILAESALNGVFFADANVAGLAGGVITALVISIVNVGAASIAGHSVRQKNHATFLRKLVGCLALILGVCFAFFTNFLVGHFRDLTATVDWNEAAGAAFERVVAGHAQMQSLDAWLLTGLGLLFAAIAGWKAYGAVDPYPGYSRVSDKFDQKRRDWQELRDETFRALIETRDSAVTDLGIECDKLQSGFKTAQGARTGLLALAGQRRVFLQECDRISGDLLAVYRDANRKARSTPEPGYFRQAFSFPAEEELVEPPPPNSKVARHLADVVEKAVERIHRTCQDAMDSFDGDRSGRA